MDRDGKIKHQREREEIRVWRKTRKFKLIDEKEGRGAVKSEIRN